MLNKIGHISALLNIMVGEKEALKQKFLRGHISAMMGVSEVQWTTREGDPGPERFPE
jgi:hypothetical protein